jgi:RHS repeat-associated protein
MTTTIADVFGPSGRFLRFVLRALIGGLALLGVLGTVLQAQNYLTSTGDPGFGMPYPAEMGTVDAATGNLHLEIPLGSFTQRGTSAAFVPKLLYDSHIWTVPTDGMSRVWTTQGSLYGLAFGTWAFSEGGAVGLYQMASSGNGCNEDMMLWSQSGTQHYFNIPGSFNGFLCTGGTAYATDSSGFQIRQSAWGTGVNAQISVYAPDGTQIYGSQLYSNSIAAEDPNGNYLGLTYANNGGPGIYNPAIDTLGRDVVTVLGNNYSSPMTLQVMNSQGGTSNYLITYTTIPVKTNFQQNGVAECNTNCTAGVIQSVTLPDGSQYSFLYDCDDSQGNPACNSPGGQSAYYGTLTRMTLPTGQHITYSYYNNFTDAAGNVGQWLVSKASSFATWSYRPSVLNSGGWSRNYPCAPGALVQGCQQTIVQRPDGSSEVTLFAIDNGAWPSLIQSYDTDGSTLLSTVRNWWDFSIPCTLNICGSNGSQDVRKFQTQTTLPVPGGNLYSQATYTYDSPQTANITKIGQWKYRNSSTFPSVPDRTTYISYQTIGTNNDINHPISKTVCNNVGAGDANCPGYGATVARTTITYDEYGQNGSLALASVTNVKNHDDSSFGIGYTARGNPTQISSWVSGTTYLTTALSYDTTGQVTQVLDSNNNATSYSYANAFYDDNGADPPITHSGAPITNAFVTTVTDAIGSTSMGYYYGSGKLALSTDYDAMTTYSHYVDPFDRPTETDYPIGWVLNQYHLPIEGLTELDSYAAVGDTTAKPSCTSCAHTQAILDSLGRMTTQNLVNNPAGQSQVASTYDGLNRVSTASHPNFGPSDPNDVVETQTYDGLGRVTVVTHPDGQTVRSAYGAQVAGLSPLLTQQGSPATYGYGFPVVSVDEAGKPRQEWIDGFGHVIEVDEPVLGQSPGEGSATVSGAELETYGCTGDNVCGVVDDSGTVGVVVNGYTTNVDYGLDSSGQPTNCWPGDASNDTAAIVAARLATAINNDSGSFVTAFVTGTSIALTAKTGGGSTNYTLSWNPGTSCIGLFGLPGQSFSITTSGSTLTGGSNNSPTLLNPNVTLYQYSATGNVTNVLQGSQIRTFAYDGLNRLTQETTPEAGTVKLSYVTSTGALCSGDPSNPCIRQAPAPNQTGSLTVNTKYVYNLANQLIQKTHSDTTGTETYTYGTSAANFNIGRLTKMVDPSGSESYGYDKMGRVVQLAKAVGTTSYVTKYAYNSGSELTKITYPSGRVVEYSYDLVGDLCEAAATVAANCGSATSPYLTLPSSGYDAASRPLSATYGNGVVATASYTPQTGELASLSYAKNSSALFGLNYFYQQNATYCPTGNAGNNGQIQCITDVSSGTGASGRSVAYTYDQLGRLLTANTTGSAQYPAWGLSWTYDRYGNRTAQTVTAGSGYTSSLTINPVNNQITSPAYTYDATGNVMAEPAPLSASYAYDGEECNTGFTGNGNTATYTCDGNELRVKKVVTGTNAVTTVSIRSGGQVIAEYDNGAAVTAPTREYLYGNNLLATVTGSTSGSGGTIIYQQRDHLSPRLYTDVNGNDVSEQGTYPFGESWYNNNTTSNWVYTSYERDAESGNDYALARSYANSNGRFLSPDPLEGIVGDPQSWNRYAYVENDPINLSDPSGQGFWEDLGLAIASVFVDALCQACIPAMTAVDEGAAGAQAAQDIEAVLQAAGLIAVWSSPTGRTKMWGCVGGPCSQGSDSASGGSAPQGGGGPGAGAGQDTGASGQGPSGGGATTAASGPSPTPGGGTISNPSGGSIWDECGVGCYNALWNVSNFVAGAGDALTIGGTKLARKATSWAWGMGYGENVNYSSKSYWGGAVTGTALSIATGPRGPVFGFKGIYNNRGPLSPLLRIGFGEKQGVGLVFRGASGGTLWKTGISMGYKAHLFDIPMNGVRQVIGWLW